MITVAPTQIKSELSSFIDVTLPSHVTGDYILIIASNDRGSNTITIDQTGYSEAITQYRYTSARSALFYKKAATNSESNPRLTGSGNSTWIVNCLVIKADPTQFFDFAVQNDNVLSHNADCLGGTTTVNNCVILRGVFADSEEKSYFNLAEDGVGDAISIVDSYANTLQQRIFYTFQRTAGVVPAFRVGSDNLDCQTFSIAIRPGAELPPIVESEVEAIGLGVSYLSRTNNINPLSNIVTTLNGNAVDTTTPSLSDNTAGDTTYLQINTGVKTVSLPRTIGAYITLDSNFDFRDKIYSVSIVHENYGQLSEEGLIHLFIDNNDNWVALAPVGKDDYPDSSIYSIYLEPEEMTVLDSLGTIDWSSINKLGFAYFDDGASTASRQLKFFNPCLLGNIIFSNFDDLTPKKIGETLSFGGSPTRSSAQGLGQVVLYASYQIGDGVNATTYSQSTNSNEYPAVTDNPIVDITSSLLEVRVKASANDTFDFSSSISATESLQKFIIDENSSPDATYNWTGWSCIGKDVAWLASGVPCNGASFLKCETIDIRGSNFSQTNFRNSISTNACVTIIDGANLSNCTFTKGAEAYAIEITETGTYDISGATFNGYTNEINVTATSGTVNIQLGAGDSEPDYQTAGATVVFLSQSTDITVINLTSSYVYLEDDQGDQVDYEANTTGTYNYSIASGNPGQWKLVIDRQGYQRKTFNFTVDGNAREYDGALVLSKNFDGTNKYTGVSTSSINVNTSNDRIELQAGSIEAQLIYNACQDRAVLADGMADDAIASVDFAVTAFGQELQLGDYRLMRSPTATGLPIVRKASITQNQDTPVDEANGQVGIDGSNQLSVSGSSLTAVQIREEIDDNSTKLGRIDALIEDSNGDRFTAKALETSTIDQPTFDGLMAGTPNGTKDSFKANVDISNLASQSSVDSIQTDVTAINNTVTTNLDVTVSSRSTFNPSTTTVTSNIIQVGGQAVTIANFPTTGQIEGALLNEGDGQQLIDAISSAIGNVNVDEVVLVASIQSSLEREGGPLDQLPTLADIESSMVLAKESTLTAINNNFANVSTFDPATTTVRSNVVEVNDSAITIDSFKADVSGLATSANIPTVTEIRSGFDEDEFKNSEAQTHQWLDSYTNKDDWKATATTVNLQPVLDAIDNLPTAEEIRIEIDNNSRLMAIAKGTKKLDEINNLYLILNDNGDTIESYETYSNGVRSTVNIDEFRRVTS